VGAGSDAHIGLVDDWMKNVRTRIEVEIAAAEEKRPPAPGKS
jgi:hypothetical protein